MINGRPFEDVRVGEELPIVLRCATTRQLVEYAGVSGDFSEIHYDEGEAKRRGLPGVIVHGLLKAAWFATFVANWAGPDALLWRLETSYNEMDFPGEPLNISGRVFKTWVEESCGKVEIELWALNPAGLKTTTGIAEIRTVLRVSEASAALDP